MVDADPHLRKLVDKSERKMAALWAQAESDVRYNEIPRGHAFTAEAGRNGFGKSLWIAVALQ